MSIPEKLPDTPPGKDQATRPPSIKVERFGSRLFFWVFFSLSLLFLIPIAIHEYSFWQATEITQRLTLQETFASTIFAIFALSPLILSSSFVGRLLARALCHSRHSLIARIPLSAFAQGVLLTVWMLLLYGVKILLGHFPPGTDLHLGQAALIMPIVSLVVFSIVNGILVLVTHLRFRRHA
jgi:hypothetical protein